MSRDSYPVRWAGWQAMVTLPGRIEMSNAGQIREELLLVINRGAIDPIADMTATVPCDEPDGRTEAAGSGSHGRRCLAAMIFGNVFAAAGSALGVWRLRVRHDPNGR